MKKNITSRLDLALNKLYQAFTQGTLNPECCMACAVGNICDNRDGWKFLTDTHGSTQLNYIGQVNEALGKRHNGYLPSELLKIEAVFLDACGFELPIKRGNYKPKVLRDDTIFKALCAVIEYLCALDKVDNVLDYKNIFERSLISRKEVAHNKATLAV